MVLDPGCLTALREAMDGDVGLAVGDLRDPMLGQVVGIKLFRTECVRRIAMRDTISPDTDLVSDFGRAGWRTVFLGHGGRAPGVARPTYGEHRPDYTPAYTYQKFLLEGRRCRYRRAYGALWWRFNTLDARAREEPAWARIAMTAQIATAIGFFRRDLRDGLKPVSDDSQRDRLFRILDSGVRDDEVAMQLPPVEGLSSLGDVFRRHVAAGAALAAADAGETFRETFAALRGSRSNTRAVAARLGLCYGMFATDQSRIGREAALLAVRAFLLRSLEERGGLKHQVKKAASHALARIPGVAATRRWLRPYHRSVQFLQRRRFDWLRPGPVANTGAAGPVAYVLLRYPNRTETFIRREVHAVRQAGIELEVFARDGAGGVMATDPPPGPVTHYGPVSRNAGRAAWLRFARRQPRTALRLTLFVARHPYPRDKTWWRDRDVLYEAAFLSERLGKAGITRIHSPWADRAALLGLLASRMLGVPFSLQARASEIHRSSERAALADRLRFADFIVTNSRYNERFLTSILPAPRPPIHVIYNGLDLARFETSAVPLPTPVSRLPAVLSIGRLVEPKGFRYLLLACHRLREAGFRFTCEIIGGPRDPDDTVTWLELRKMHSALGLESIVRFRGEQPFPEVLAAYRRSDVFVLPCVRARTGSHDITPNALIEAMAMRMPVVSSTSGAIPELVDDGLNGILVPPADDESLAAALRCLLLDPDRRRLLGDAARRKVEERFDIERNARQRTALFRPLPE
jgi:glycosyltransferase involved in cell wall biosynthesis